MYTMGLMERMEVGLKTALSILASACSGRAYYAVYSCSKITKFKSTSIRSFDYDELLQRFYQGLLLSSPWSSPSVDVYG